MFAKHPVAEIASLFADPARVAMLMDLLDGGSRPAGELAREAAVSPQAASAHLAKLVEAGLVMRSQQGRHRYFRLASPEVGVALEALAATARPAPRELVAKPVDEAGMLRFARTCYDHLAGVLGVRVATAMEKNDLIEPQGQNFSLTPRGEQWFKERGYDVAAARSQRRQFARRCLDWTERHHHIGGAVGAMLLGHFLRYGWMVRCTGTRALRVTARGERELERFLQS
ncbi:MAG TPA: helix-turn-helix transcriptional regulator [Bryobacteraceae bacterium]|jgi:DNA-binding transcriptional ArsR family regulator